MRHLFNVSKLIDFGYDDASVDATPVILELDARSNARSAALPGITVGTALSSIGAAAATAAHDTAASTWAALTAPGTPAPRAFGAEPTAGALAGGVVAVHLDGQVEATLDSSVPWIGAPEAWEAGYTGAGVTVAVLDTGYDDTHPDLAGRVLAESQSFVPDQAVDHDPNGHGTHVASTIAGTGAAGDGVHRGVADGAELLVGKVLSDEGFGQDSWIIAAMEWAAERAPIVSMSLGSREPSDGTDLMAEALDDISEETGALFVVAAGNSTAPGSIGSPGAAVRALTVGSVDDPSGALSWFSSQGPLVRTGALKPDLTGPGSGITAARSSDSGGTGAYVSMNGTSMATPHVAGAAALVKQQHPEYTADELRAVLTSSSRDVGLTPYQTGAGTVDVAAAVEATVVATGSGDFGMLTWGETPEPVVRTIEYANNGDAEVTVSLEPTLADTTPGDDGGGGGLPGPRSADPAILSMDAESLTIPAGETRSVTLTADPAAVPAGRQFSGALVASIGDEPIARTALGIIAEAERYDLTLTATDFDGKPTTATAWIWHPATEGIMMAAVDGETTLRLPAGQYSVMSYMQVARNADTETLVLVGDPDVVLDGEAASVAFDARAAKPVTVDVGEKGLESIVRRMDFSVDGFTGSALMPVYVDEILAQPMKAGEAEHFDFTNRWRLQEATLALTAGKEKLDLIVQAGSTPFDDKIRERAIYAGRGSAEEFLAAKVRGKVAVVTRSNEVSATDRAANAAAAGAKLLIVINDADGELSEWVGSADYTTNVDLAVAAISGVQGKRLLAEMERGNVTVEGKGVPLADAIWDIVLYKDGEIPKSLDYKPKKLARIDTTYHGESGTLTGEFRYDFVPGRDVASGFMFRTDRGLERTEWVNTESVEWYQAAEDIDAGWQIRDIRRGYKAGARVETSYFGAVVRPYVGPGYWAPLWSGSGIQVNIPAWADGESADRTGAFDTWAGNPGITQHGELFIDGELVKTSEYQGVNAFDIPEGEHRVKFTTTATHDGSALPSSNRTHTEWELTATWDHDDYTRKILPMLQAFYDIEIDDKALAGEGRKKGAPVELGLEIGHVTGAVGSAAVSKATLEYRTAGGTFKPVKLRVDSKDNAGPGEPPLNGFVTGRAFVTTWDAEIPVSDRGGWIDLRVTAVDEAGNTFTQEIERAFEAAPAKGGRPLIRRF